MKYRYVWMKMAAIAMLMSGCGTTEPEPIPEQPINGQQQNSSVTVQNEAASGDAAEEEQALDAADILSPLPDEFSLSFAALQLEELQQGGPDEEWTLMRSIPFGKINKHDAVLSIYEENRENEMLPRSYSGVLLVNKTSYWIRDVSSSLAVDNEEADQTRLFQRMLPGQTRYELIGGLELFANGPGRALYLIYDHEHNRLTSFESWGKPDFIDLDGDGEDEFFIEFQGLHLSWPDLSILRVNNGVIELSSSVVDPIRRNQGDYAALIRDQQPPLIRLSNIQNEEVMDDYLYLNGKLIRKPLNPSP
ncbi:hypothetical protein [Paenibacillus radicis (ex Gao et al. 2016)]|uniref:Lipoprotein n=1 Tax=Paenibacillus radicis (ex Gao et al. 2016) TaxID=1737354 RepID=A0A917GYX2_9BACL|nr:hypothetical protein [Paenibacillus radicis (ex Gao et al. 2016)]GGG61051.1 hypothetical protein GCM10010918_13040 [Paenibacillus radicis (ex Gao et al. 2016)]